MMGELWWVMWGRGQLAGGDSDGYSGMRSGDCNDGHNNNGHPTLTNTQ